MLSCLIIWDMLCNSYNQGGLDILIFIEMNPLPLCKWLWNMMSSKNSLWKEWNLKAYCDDVFPSMLTLESIPNFGKILRVIQKISKLV